jgi:thiamine pyrophosphate-dependent acetolactate synthase large subunit-like protein
MNVVEAIANAIADEGVAVAFGVPDEVTIHALEALRETGRRIVRARHEQYAVVMADAYARATGAPSVCAVGSGPAIAQTGTGLATAARHRSPVLVLIGTTQVRGHSKTFNARPFVELMGAHYLDIRGADTVAEDMHEAFRLVRLRDGPVVVGIPDAEGLHRDVPDWTYRPSPDVVRAGLEVDPNSPAIQRAVAMLSAARRPVIVAGAGAVRTGARPAIVALAERLGARLATSIQARGLFRGDARDLGVIGGFASESSARRFAQADCVLVVGATLNLYQTRGWPRATARTIQIDAVPTRIGEFVDVDLALLGDAAATVRAIHRAIERAEPSPPSDWGRVDLADPVPALAEPAANGRLPVPTMLAALDEVLPDDRTVIIDGGHFVGFAIDAISVPDPHSWVWTLDFSSIGLALSMGIGAAVAKPDRHCVVVAGDGGFLMSIQELETAVRERVPLTVVVLNDAAYAAEARHLSNAGKPLDMARFDDVDLAAVARSFGGRGVTVRTPDDVAAQRGVIARRDGVLLLDAKVTLTVPHRCAV